MVIMGSQLGVRVFADSVNHRNYRFHKRNKSKHYKGVMTIKKSDTLAKVWPCVIVKYGNAFTSYPIDLPGCGASGLTMEESLERLSEALTLHLLGMLEDGDEVPDPGSNGYELEDGGEVVQVTLILPSE